MNGSLYLFNPEHDMALANFTPYYHPPREIVRMGEDLSYLSLWYAGSGGLAKVADNDVSVSFLSECVSSGVSPYGAATTSWLGGSIFPWGWAPALVNKLTAEGVSADQCPDEMKLKRIRFLSGRQRCVEVLEQLNDVDGICGEAVECLSVSEVKDFLKKTGECILKSPWSGSGRGLLRISPGSWNDNAEGWVARVIRTQGGIMGEPLYNKVCDFAMEFYADGKGYIAFVGYSLFETDAHGNYKLNLLLPDVEIERRLLKYVSYKTLRDVKERLSVVLRSLLKCDYVGYLGVDMMICYGTDEFLVHPCVEINLRMNMGVVSRLFFDRYVSETSCGQFIVEHYVSDGEALMRHRERIENCPLKVSDEGRIIHGYLSLIPVQRVTRYQAYVVIEEVG